MGSVGVKGIFHPVWLLPARAFQAAAGSFVAGFVVCDPACTGDGEAGRLQPLENRYIGAVIDIARADASLDGPAGAGAEQSYGTGRLQRQNTGIFQQDDSRCRSRRARAAWARSRADGVG